ncbi:MAG: tyrosine--tRNA ligase, partial [Oscillospiraceae bacterium]|nr:tyrosine--tRNA ligase [Oscillospiraceae bacterium]
WRNVGDQDVLKCIRMLTFLPLEQIDEMDKWEGSELNRAKEILAYELTALVHGEEEAKKAEASAKALFVSGGSDENMPTTEIEADKLTDGAIGILDLLTLCGLIPSRGEGRRLIQQGGLTVDDEKVTTIDFAVSQDRLQAGVKIRKGKKVFHKAILK